MGRILRYALLVSLALPLMAEQNLDVLDGAIDGAPADKMMQRYLTDIAMQQLEARDKAYAAVKSPEEIAAYQKKMYDFFVQQLGGWPERTPLNARIVGEEARDGYRVQKIIYESRPQFYVTALLFLPATEGPYPGILVPCGHSDIGKACEAYQRACILLAKNGMAALIFEPMGQGERYSYFKKDGKTEFGTTLHHTVEGTGSILVGSNMAAYFIWDGMRGIDYLCSRDDIDPERIGCTGNSGGGTQSSYIMALEPRVKCAAPSCYLTSFERLLTTIGPQDAEQDIYGQIAFGMDHAEYCILRAPKPTLICAATQDFFDTDGTWATFRQAKRLYARLGFSERMDIIDYDDKHGFSQPRREAAARWMSRWLLGKDVVINEPEFDILTEEECWCTEKGQVLLSIEGARTAIDLNVERAEKLRPEREAFWKNQDRNTIFAKIRELTGMKPLDELDAPTYEIIETIQKEGYQRFKILGHPEPGIVLPALVYLPEKQSNEAVLYCDGRGKRRAAKTEDAIENFIKQGKMVFLVDLRGIGETASDEKMGDWNLKVGQDWRDFFRAYLVGKSYVGMRANDLLACVKGITEQLGVTDIHLIATRQATVPALHAAALEPAAFKSVTLEEGIPSWYEVVKEPRARQQLINCVHNALAWYDLPELKSALPKGVLTVKAEEVPTF